MCAVCHQCYEQNNELVCACGWVMPVSLHGHIGYVVWYQPCGNTSSMSIVAIAKHQEVERLGVT